MKLRMSRHHVETIVITKMVICVGLLATYFLPPHHAMVVSVASNLLWLWKT